ncbi:phytanoyl-CoA dioxygenase family protein [Nonomuraea wenchangensis]|uniref:phytanoyl-CoA dioxygenase family protein n=1 Tax=Nonomuraea wenchangensis TaxID=568860 RepID=UPI00384C1D91
MKRLQHVPATIDVEEAAAIVRRDGAVVIDNLVSPDLLDGVLTEMDPFIKATSAGYSSPSNQKTMRTGGLMGRSESARKLITHSLVIKIIQRVVTDTESLQINNTEIISLQPGAPKQALHRDQDVWPYPFPPGYEPSCSAMWPLNVDFTAENGATRLILDSHLGGFRTKFYGSDVQQAVMTRGSVMIWSGSLYHSAMDNRSDGVRQGVMLSYSTGWLRQEENQYLAVPREIAATLDHDTLRLMGYERPTPSLGNAVDRSHPLSVFHPDMVDPNLTNTRTRRPYPYIPEPL